MMLTRRQQQALVLASLGLTAREAAVELGIGEHTVKSLWAETRVRLGARSKHHAVAIGFQRGLLR